MLEADLGLGSRAKHPLRHVPKRVRTDSQATNAGSLELLFKDLSKLIWGCKVNELSAHSNHLAPVFTKLTKQSPNFPSQNKHNGQINCHLLNYLNREGQSMTSILNLVHITSKITKLARSGQITLARQLFDEMPHRDTITWNAMMSSYSQLGSSQETIKLFSDMRVSGTRPDSFSFTAVLSATSCMEEVRFGRKVHGLVVRFGYQTSLPVCNSIVDMYGKCSSASCAGKVFGEMGIRNEVSWCSLLFAYVKLNDFEHARRIFDDMPDRVELAWNIMMGGYARCGGIELCMNLFKQMKSSACRPDMWTFTALMNACVELPETFQGCMIHACIVKSGWDSAIEVSNSILSSYAKSSYLEDAVKIFDSISNLTTVSWNAMIDAHMKIGDVDTALVLFQRAPEKNVVSWTAMITGYARNGHGEEAIRFFVEMARSLLQPDDFTLGAVLHACSNLAVLEHGKMVHSCAMRLGYQTYVYVCNGLINMYAKCGDIKGSYRAFVDLCEKDLVSWNAMLFALGLHGRASEALRVYGDMIASSVRPDKVTFLGLLMACSHSGLISQGQKLFTSMTSNQGLIPDADHIACMVDMFGRAGHLRTASEFVEEYSRTATASTRETLLGACAAHGDAELGKVIGENVIRMEPQKEIGYVMLSNLYCATGQWKEAEKVRRAMVQQGVKKMPGCSWIQVGNEVTTFVVGIHSHPCMEKLHQLLNFLESEMRNPYSIGLENYIAFLVMSLLAKNKMPHIDPELVRN